MRARRESLRIRDNLYIRAKTGDRVVAERKKHNVFVYSGRLWLSKMVGSAAYPAHVFPVSNMKDTDLPTTSGGTTYSLETSWDTGDPRTYRVRWVGLGVGGVLQSDATIGPGGYVELPTVAGLESPVPVMTTAIPGYTEEWMKEVDVQDVASPTDFPEIGTIVFHALFTSTDISYVGAPYGTSVPISEVALFTSAADPFVEPKVGSYGGGDVPGIIAYGLLTPIYKTPAIDIEVIWEISFK